MWAVDGASIRETLKQQAANTLAEFEAKKQKCCTELNEQGLNVALYWENDDPASTVSVVPTSAITGEGVPDLLFMLMRSTQEQLGSQLECKEELQCTVIEVKNIETAPSNGGAMCPTQTQRTVPCNEDSCPIDCMFDSWSGWSMCSESCGNGTEGRSRGFYTESAHGGKECPALSLSAICEQPPCGINCKMSAWGAWKQCSKSCGGGVRSRIRVVVQEAASKGSQCPSLAETVPCNTDACPADCKVSGWSAWTKCTSACGGGRKTRTRTVLAAPDAYGVQCPPRSAVLNCNSHACAVDCKMSRSEEHTSELQSP